MTTYSLASDVHDIYVDGERAAVYLGDTVLVLGPLASALVQWLRDGTNELSTLTGLAIATFGPPLDADAGVIVANNLEDLRESGVVI